jgi:hypothetical protein
MSGRVWISSMKGNSQIGNKQGIRTKYFGEEWRPAKHIQGVVTDEVMNAINKNAKGFALQRNELPEAAAIWDEKCFARIHDLFAVGGFYAVKGRLAEILSRFDLGDGGLVPFPIYKADLVTPMEGEFSLLNFGARKNSFLAEQSENVAKFAVDYRTGIQYWEVKSWHEDGDVGLSPAAFDGPDLWYEEIVYNKIFMSDALASALQEAGLAEDWCLRPCRIVETRS